MNEIFRYVDEEQAFSLQQDMAERVSRVDDPGFNPRLICGIDVSYDGDKASVAATVWDIDRKQPVEKVSARYQAFTKYVPSLFGFREGPLLIGISRELESSPDVFLVYGHGVAHPRGFGLACQFGLAVDRPTIGVAKSLLYGRPENRIVVDPEGHSIAGIITTAGGKKFYVSVGHRISLVTACRLVERCVADGHPMPLRLAHLDAERSRGGAIL